MRTLEDCIKEFIEHCKFEKNLSLKTLKAYSIDLNQLRSFLLDRECSTSILLITKKELREYLECISNLKPKSIKRKIATIKAMFNFLEFEDYIMSNPIRKMRIQIREPKRLPKVMNIDEINRIFKYAYNQLESSNKHINNSYTESLRNILVIELLFATGARVSEIANLKEENINTTTGAITIFGKGNKERILQICNKETLHILRSYCFSFNEKIKNSGGFLLINRFGKKLSDQSIRNIVKKLTTNSGINKHITPHVFRHSFGTLLLEKDVDIKYIQTLLGHSSITTTQIYTHVNREKQIQILTAKHPRKDFSMYLAI